MKKTLLRRIYYGALAALLIATLIAQCVLTASEGRSLANTFSYFTIQANVLVIITSVLMAVYPNLKGAWWRVLRLASLVGITVTGIVYIFFLSRYIHLSGLGLLYNHIFHYVVPIASVVGYFFFESRQSFRWRDFLFLAWPIAWLGYTMIRGAFFDPQFTGFTTVPSKYPYEFLDVTRVPMSEVVLSITLVAAIIIAVGVMYILCDKRKKPMVQEDHAKV